MVTSKPLSFLINPTVGEAESAVKEAIAQHKTLLVVGNCWVDYLGRARSTLEPGERILMIKGDGSLLVHRPVGYEPVNWQPPGCIFHTQKERTFWKFVQYGISQLNLLRSFLTKFTWFPRFIL